MRAYTDAVLKLKVNPEFLADGEPVTVSFRRRCGDRVVRLLKVESSLYDDETGEIMVMLTQRQTAALEGDIEVQVNGWLNGMRWASKIAVVNVAENLQKEVLEHGN